MSSMFSSCESLESIDVSGFDTSKVTKMSYMFYSCSGLSSLDISGFDTSNATNMNNMFRNCSSLTSLDVSGFDTSKVTNISRMFSGCTVLPYVDLSGFSTSKVTKADYYADVFTDLPLLLANCNSYYTQYLTKGYQTTIETVFTPSENAKTVIVSVGDRSEEFNIEDIPDYYYSAAEEDGVYLFTGENLEGGICAGLYNDAEQNDNISSTSEYSGPFTIRAKLNASQTVYLRPTGYNSYDSCDYTVSVTKKEVVVREPIALTLDTETEGNFEDIDDYDRFSFTADEDGTYIIKGKTHEMRDIYGYLYSDEAMTESFDIDGGYPNWTDDYVYFTIRVDLTAGQTVYLKPELDSEYGSGSYTISVNKKIFAAIPLTLSTPKEGHFENSDEFDFFSFTAESEGTYTFTSESYSDTYGYLYGTSDLSDDPIASNDDDGGNYQFRIEYYLEAGQTVYLLPIRYGWENSCDYTVTVEKYYEPLDIYSIEELDATISIDPAKESEKTNFSCNSSTAYVKINGYDTVDDSSVTVTYGIDLELDPNEAEYEIVLYDGSGSGIISVNNYSVVKSVNFTVYSDCAYIKITRLDDEAIGNATLEYTYLGRASTIYA